MTQPKFYVGQRVAVFTMRDRLVAHPDTEVTFIEYARQGCIYRDHSGKPYISGDSGWYYEVSAQRGWTFAERCLRPLNDDDYKDITEDSEVPASGVRT